MKKEIFHSSREKTCVTKGKCITLGMSKMCRLGYVYCISFRFMGFEFYFLLRLVFPSSSAWIIQIIMIRVIKVVQGLGIFFIQGTDVEDFP